MSKQSSSLFDQALDRSVFVTYFLGAIVPLIGFAVLSERLAPLLPERNEQLALAGVVIATGLLSFGAFLALRRIVLRTIARVTTQNDRLEALLHVARDLGRADHAQMVDDATAAWAIRLVDADASWVIERETPDKPITVSSERGDDAADWFGAHVAAWLELATPQRGEDPVVRIEAGEAEGPSSLVAPLASETGPDGWLVVARREGVFEAGAVDALSTLAALAGTARINTERGDSQRNFFSHMTELVVAALDTHILCRAGHAKRVAATANRVGRAMGLDDEALHDLHFAALLHDVGMLRVPAEHQRDPQYFRKHPVYGQKMLSRIRVWERAAPIVGQHHERPDGGGYPDRLSGDAICLGARILAVCDAWDAMRSDDVDRPAMAQADALAELEANAGGQFDPAVIATLESLIREGEVE